MENHYIKVYFINLSLDGEWYIKNYLILSKLDNFDLTKVVTVLLLLILYCINMRYN
jgi:hypothetical protein